MPKPSAKSSDLPREELLAAVERLSARLAERLDDLVRMRGGGITTYRRQQAVPGAARAPVLVTASMTLPSGHGVVLRPRDLPDGDGWIVDVVRSDGVTRERWAAGLRVAPRADDPSRYGLWLGGALAGDGALAALVEDLGRPLPPLALDPFRFWNMRFGPMPADALARLEATDDPARMGELGALFLAAGDRAEALRRLFELTAPGRP